MAKDNTTLGRFQLDGIPPARRGVPQVEVTFDIDANGIVNVSAKDMGTGKVQHITITSSTHLTEEEIQNKVKEAEEFAESDKKLKDLIEARNQADAMIYEVEKSLKENEADATPQEKAEVEEKIEAAKKALETEDAEAIKKAVEDLTNAFNPIAQKIYSKANAQGPADGAAPQDDNVVDADYEVVD